MPYELSIRTNAAGETDLDYYLREAKAMRQQAFLEFVNSTAHSLKTLIVAVLTIKLDFKRQVSFGTLLGH